MGEKGCLRRKGVFGGKKRCLGGEKGCWGYNGGVWRCNWVILGQTGVLGVKRGVGVYWGV